MNLSWDLHIHPGPSSVPRWGDGLEIWRASQAAGVSGFVWKSHEHHTVDDCSRLPNGPPFGIPGASLNAWSTLQSVVDAIDAGARWLWAPTQDEHGQVAWDLPLPNWWPELKSDLLRRKTPLALATGHSDTAGRHAFAEVAAGTDHLHCTVTHAVRLTQNELTHLGDMGATFELDLYTSVFEIGGANWSSFTTRAREVYEHGWPAYIASDAGQLHVGNPFDFSSAKLSELELALGPDVVKELAGRAPSRFCTRVFDPRGAG